MAAINMNAVSYFYSNLPGMRDKSARQRHAEQLASAEAWTKANGAGFGWTIDAEIQFDDATPAWRCSIYLSGKVVAVSAPENFGRVHPWNDGYGYSRVSEATLALEYLTDLYSEPATVSMTGRSATQPALALCAA